MVSPQFNVGLPLAEAAEGYRLFEKQEARKVVLKL